MMKDRVLAWIYGHALNRLSAFRRYRFESVYRSGNGFGTLEMHENIASAVFEALPSKRFKSALDLGCGYGFFTNRIAENSDSVKGIDISQTAIQNARACRHPRARFLTADVINYCGTDGEYDLIICMGIIPYLPERYLPAVRQNIDRMLDAGGILLLFERKGATGSNYQRFLEGFGYPLRLLPLSINGTDFKMYLMEKTQMKTTEAIMNERQLA